MKQDQEYIWEILEKATVVKRQDYEEAAKLRDKERNLQSDLDIAKREWDAKTKDIVHDVTNEDIATVVAMMTGIPVNRIAQTESDKLLKMDDSLKEQIVGQDEAVAKLTKAIRRTRAGLKNPNRPIGSFIFLGPTGVGKTELCKALARYLFDSEDSLVRIDMSEYMEKFSLSRLVGAPPGYVGYEEGGQLTEKVRRKPYSVVLFDEIEKAHPDIFSILLQVLDDGLLTDSLGRKVDFRNTIIIMTSNIGTKDIRDISSFGFGDEKKELDVYAHLKDTVEDAMKKLFNPEFLNRIDDTIVFGKLSREHIMKIIEIEIKGLYKNLEDNKLDLLLDQTAKEFLVDKGFDEKFGARPLKRAIQRYVEDPLAEEILRGSFKEGTKIIAKHVEKAEELVFYDEALETESPSEEANKSDSN
jgi:ATP-dependent Clp protease ATP-binding subunit ClpC